VENKLSKAFNSRIRNVDLTGSNCRTACSGWGGCMQFDLVPHILNIYIHIGLLVANVIYPYADFIDSENTLKIKAPAYWVCSGLFSIFGLKGLMSHIYASIFNSRNTGFF
jgi:hypothetical protein